MYTAPDHPEPAQSPEFAAPDADTGERQAATTIAGCAVVAAIFLLFCVVGALVVAQVQVIRVAARDEKIADLEEQVAGLERQLAQVVRDRDALLDQASDPPRVVRQTPSGPPPRRPLDVADPGTPDPPAPEALFTVSTRVAATAPPDPTQPFPRPERFDRRVGELVPNVGGTGQWDQLNLPYTASSGQALRPRDYSPMAFDADYEHAYIVDGDTVLHKLNLETLREVARLELGAACSEIAVSEAGLVVGLHHLGRVWVIDPDTLEVRYELRLQSVEHVAASPALPIAWAVGKEEAFAFDVVSGAVLNRMSLRDSRSLSSAMSGRFGSGLMAFRITRDGQYAYTANRKLHQFRVEGTQLTYLASTPGLSSGHMRQMSMSRDGQWVARPAGGGLSQGPYAIPLFRSDDLDDPALVIQTGAYPNYVDWDLTAGTIISQNHDEVLIFSPRGRITQRLKRVRGDDIFEIAALPIGNRFILWTNGRIAVWDLEPGRLAELIAVD